MGTDVEGYGVEDTRERLGTAWRNGSTAEALGILNDDVRRWCVRWLIGRFGHQGISEEDAEDCFSDAMEGLLNRDASKVSDPYNYVFTSAKNAALDTLDERKRLVKRNPEWEGQEDDIDEYGGGSVASTPSAWTSRDLLIVTEATLDIEVSGRTEQLRNLYRHVLPKLKPARRRLVEVLLERGADISVAALADVMNSSMSAVRSLKSRTFSDLRTILPTSAQEMGIDFDQFVTQVPEVIDRIPLIPSPEEENEPIL